MSLSVCSNGEMCCDVVSCVIWSVGGEAMLHDGRSGATLHQGGHSPSLLPTFLEPAHGLGSEELQTGLCLWLDIEKG